MISIQRNSQSLLFKSAKAARDCFISKAPSTWTSGAEILPEVRYVLGDAARESPPTGKVKGLDGDCSMKKAYKHESDV